MNQAISKEPEKYWFTMLPDNWKTGRIKDLYNQISNTGSELNDGTYIPLENLESLTGKLLQRINNENNETTNLFCKGDILVNKLRPYLAKVHLAEFDGGVSGEVVVLRNSTLWKNFSSNRYFFYRFLSSAFIYKINSLSKGVKMPRTNPSKILALEIAIPPLQEQTAIAKYLDTKTLAIDTKVSLLKRKIDYYQELRGSLINEAATKGLDKNVNLKYSGIPWIGQVPRHWKTLRLKDMSEIRFSNVDKKEKESQDNVLLCNYNDVYNNEFISSTTPDFMPNTASESQVARFELRQGDILCTKESESFDDIASPAEVLQDMEGVLCGYHLALIRPNQIELFPGYLLKLLQSDAYNHWFRVNAKGITRVGLPISSFSDLTIALPSIQEQREIAKYLSEKTLIIDKIIRNIQAQVSILKELRKTLINDVTIGKIKVLND